MHIHAIFNNNIEKGDLLRKILYEPYPNNAGPIY
jgi:hypothetical protein|tara:strand:- start:242 stop:343 length:102 start_codon:yes stop_codon:yes gene_type:complete